MERVIEIVAGIHRKDQGRQHAEAEDCADDPFRPAAAGEHGCGVLFYLCFQHGKRHRATGNKHPQRRQQRRGENHKDNGRHRVADVVGLHGAAHFPHQREVPREHRLVPHLDFDPVEKGEGADEKVHQRCAVKDIFE